MRAGGAISAVLAVLMIGLSMGAAGRSSQPGVNQALLLAEQPAPTLQAYRFFADSQGHVAQP